MRVLLPLLLVLALPASAQVYKSVGPNGRPIYTDRPLPDAQALFVPMHRRDPAPTATDPGTPPTERGFLGAYDAFAIVAPDEGATIRNADGVVGVSLLLDPPLREGHRLSLDVDGVAAAGDLGARTQLQLQGVTVGSHRLMAVIRDESGTVVASTPLVNFHFRAPLPPGSLP
jgi:hypothetical protein